MTEERVPYLGELPGFNKPVWIDPEFFLTYAKWLKPSAVAVYGVLVCLAAANSRIYTHKDLAAILNTGRGTVSTALFALRAHNIITVTWTGEDRRYVFELNDKSEWKPETRKPL